MTITQSLPPNSGRPVTDAWLVALQVEDIASELGKLKSILILLDDLADHYHPVLKLDSNSQLEYEHYTQRVDAIIGAAIAFTEQVEENVVIYASHVRAMAQCSEVRRDEQDAA